MKILRILLVLWGGSGCSSSPHVVGASARNKTDFDSKVVSTTFDGGHYATARAADAAPIADVTDDSALLPNLAKECRYLLYKKKKDYDEFLQSGYISSLGKCGPYRVLTYDYVSNLFFDTSGKLFADVTYHDLIAAPCFGKTYYGEVPLDCKLVHVKDLTPPLGNPLFGVD